MHPWYEHAPWDAVWSMNPGEVMAKSAEVRDIYVAPVNTQYLNQEKNDQGVWVSMRKVDQDDIDAITTLMRSSFIDAINKNPGSNLRVQDSPGPKIWTLELALRELVPTKVGVNTVADVGGLVLPGSKLIEDAVSVGGQAAGGAMASGSIAMEFKLLNPAGVLMAEVQDREKDPASVIPNIKDFEEFGWSRRTVRDWAQQFVEVFSTPLTTRVSPDSNISIAPW